MSDSMLLTNALLIDGTGAPARPGTSILIEGTHITAVGMQAGSQANQSNARQIDATGCSVIPGLMDSHAHLSYIPHARGPMGLNDSVSLEENTIHALGNATTYLLHGFTTILDVGTRGRIASAVRDAVAAGRMPGPHVVASGQVISTTGGLMNSYPEWIEVRNGNGTATDGATAIRHEVRRQSLMGVDNIKLGVTGQLSTRARDWVLLSADEVAVAVDEARRRNLTVAAHAYGPRAVRAALEGGVNTLHHGFAGLDEATLDLWAAGSAFLVPTAMVFIDKTPPSTWPSAALDYYEHHLEGYVAALEQIAGSELKARMVVGSDSGISNPTASTAKEILLFQRLGLSPEEAIGAATGTAARALRIDHQTGTIEPGKQADLCVVKGDLSVDLSPLLTPANFLHVVQSGRVVACQGVLS